MSTLAILLGIAFVITLFVALSYRDECKQWRAHHTASLALYGEYVKLEYYANYLEARLSMTNQIYASGMMYAGWVNVKDKMYLSESERV